MEKAYHAEKEKKNRNVPPDILKDWDRTRRKLLKTAGKAKDTNAEMIRKMSDEELAVTIMCPNETGHADIPYNHSDDCDCYKCCLEWLRKEKEE